MFGPGRAVRCVTRNAAAGPQPRPEQARPAAASHGQPRPATASHGQPRPASASHGQPRPATLRQAGPRCELAGRRCSRWPPPSRRSSDGRTALRADGRGLCRQRADGRGLGVGIELYELQPRAVSNAVELRRRGCCDKVLRQDPAQPVCVFIAGEGESQNKAQPGAPSVKESGLGRRACFCR